MAVLHFVGDDDNPAAIVAALRDAVPAGSYLVVSHVTGDIRRDVSAQAAVHYRRVTPGATLRSREEILRLLVGWDLVEPGLVQVPFWRPDDIPADAAKVWFLGGVGRKPAALAEDADAADLAGTRRDAAAIAVRSASRQSGQEPDRQAAGGSGD